MGNSQSTYWTTAILEVGGLWGETKPKGFFSYRIDAAINHGYIKGGSTTSVII